MYLPKFIYGMRSINYIDLTTPASMTWHKEESVPSPQPSSSLCIGVSCWPSALCALAFGSRKGSKLAVAESAED